MLQIKVLGGGCSNCINLAKMCTEILEENKIEGEVTKVTDFQEIMKYGILTTPGLVINEKVIHSGKLPTKATLANWIIKHNN